MNKIHALATAVLCLTASACSGSIDRHALVNRNNPHITTIDDKSSLTVGNGGFAYTVDVTGLQTFPDIYKPGVPLGTQSEWGWHSFANPDSLQHSETLKSYDFGRGHEELYACQFREDGRSKDASNWFRVNPHRLHLGYVGFSGLEPAQISDIDQTLDMWTGNINSQFKVDGTPVTVNTSCHPDRDMIAAEITSEKRLPIAVRFPYPTGGHCDDATDWTKDDLHLTEVVSSEPNSAVLRHTIDSTSYYVTVNWTGNATGALNGRNEWVLTPADDQWSFTAEFTPEQSAAETVAASQVKADAEAYWTDFWKNGGVVDFSECTDPRAKELERRVVLSQYLLAAQCAGSTPPQETGLTYNSWFGKFHLEMIWWHQAQFALYGHENLLARTLPWYQTAMPIAREIAQRQGFDGVRWMKMTDPSAMEAPSNVGSFLIWQQPHIIYLAELLYRANPDPKLLEQFGEQVEETAKFMESFVTYDADNNRYSFQGM
ncbi:MAG: hypothetical protein K2K92_08745, partial [Duncaniella sp.]|nr:hypothetical protein [Duncaniella sp.]